MSTQIYFNELYQFIVISFIILYFNGTLMIYRLTSFTIKFKCHVSNYITRVIWNEQLHSSVFYFLSFEYSMIYKERDCFLTTCNCSFHHSKFPLILLYCRRHQIIGKIFPNNCNITIQTTTWKDKKIKILIQIVVLYIVQQFRLCKLYTNQLIKSFNLEH